MWRAALALLAAAALAGCGYHLVGTSSFLPPELDTLYVERFANNTSWVDVDQRLLEAVTREWLRRRRFVIVDDPDDAKLVLSGTVNAVMISPVTFDDRGRATTFQMVVNTRIQLKDVREEEPKLLWEDPGFSRRTSYEVDVTAVDYFDRQMQALEELSVEYARALVSAVLEGF